MLYSVWEDGQDVSIDMDLESAKEFAHECHQHVYFEVKEVGSEKVVYSSKDYVFSKWYKG